MANKRQGGDWNSERSAPESLHSVNTLNFLRTFFSPCDDLFQGSLYLAGRKFSVRYYWASLLISTGSNKNPQCGGRKGPWVQGAPCWSVVPRSIVVATLRAGSPTWLPANQRSTPLGCVVLQIHTLGPPTGLPSIEPQWARRAQVLTCVETPNPTPSI